MTHLLFLGALTLATGLSGIARAYPRVRRRMVWNPRRVDRRAIQIRGIAEALTPIRSPIDGMQGVLAYTRVAAAPALLFRGGPRAEIATARDFAVRTLKGRVLVRAGDLWVRDFGAPSGVLGPMPTEAKIAARIREAGLDPAGVLHYREMVVFPGDVVRVTGIVTEELAPPELGGSSYREESWIRTLSGGEGPVVVELA